MRGRVKWFDDKRGYGFITTDEGADVYVHFTAIISAGDGYRTLKHNWCVEFEVAIDGSGREEARNVVVLPKSQTDTPVSYAGDKRSSRRKGRRR